MRSVASSSKHSFVVLLFFLISKDRAKRQSNVCRRETEQAYSLRAIGPWRDFTYRHAEEAAEHELKPPKRRVHIDVDTGEEVDEELHSSPPACCRWHRGGLCLVAQLLRDCTEEE